jgi:hypothetical protein
MTQLGGSSVSPGGVQSATVTLTAAQLRALSAGAQGFNIVPNAPTGKRIFFLGAMAYLTAFTVLFGAGSLFVSSNTDATGAGSGVSCGTLNNLGVVANNVLNACTYSTPVGSAIDVVGEGIYIFPTNYVTAGANVGITITVLYQTI